MRLLILSVAFIVAASVSSSTAEIAAAPVCDGGPCELLAEPLPLLERAAPLRAEADVRLCALAHKGDRVRVRRVGFSRWLVTT